MSIKTDIKEVKRAARHERIRKRVAGVNGRPRLCVHRSLNNIYAQMVDDVNGKVIFGLSTLNKEIRKKLKDGGNIPAAAVLGEAVASLGVKKGIKQVSFDRGGYLYHGRIKAFADAARKGGLEF